MILIRKHCLLLLGLLISGAVPGQNLACFVEHAGIVSCVSGDHESPEKSQSPQVPAHCCLTHAHNAVLLVKAADAPTVGHTANFVSSPDSSMPEGPIGEIEHPPQLS